MPFSDFLSNITSFNTSVVIPFISTLFTENIGIIFVAVTSFVVVISVLGKLIKQKF